MGQPVNPLLGNTQALLGSDPELYRQQLVQAEQSRIQALPPQQALAAQLGTLFGRGLGNVATGQNFFEVTNPVLRKLTDIQSIYDTAMKNSDPNDPVSFYKNLQEGFAGKEGLGVQALMAAQERRKVEGEVLKTASARMNYFKENPDLINAEIDRLTELGTPQALKEADSFKELKTRISRDQEFKLQSSLLDLASKESTIKVNEAKIEELRREAREGKVQIAQFPATTTSPAYVAVFRNGKLENQFPVGASSLGDMPGTPAPKPGESKEKPSAAQFDQRKQPSAPATSAPSATPTQAPAPAANLPALDPQTRIYYAARDPVLTALKEMAAADPQRLATDPAYFASITKARNDQIETLKRQYGNMVSFEGL